MATSNNNRHTMIAWVEDKPGVLNRVSGLFGRRNFNIESLTVGHTEKPGVSRMTFVVNGDERDVQQVSMQLYKLINVLEVQDVTGEPRVEYELALIRVRANSSTRGEIMQLVDIYRADVVDVDISTVIIRILAKEERVDGLLRLLDQFGIEEMVRTGRVAMIRGSRVAQQPPKGVVEGNGRPG
ncbi:MAG: acetolactate synthase small subunit [Chloroflexi bacterium]|jgi:acetolactate synthase-1/3 small subunit|nr:acetolactate synthase small subunit [Chloroflexota bacterium]